MKTFHNHSVYKILEVGLKLLTHADEDLGRYGFGEKYMSLGKDALEMFYAIKAIEPRQEISKFPNILRFEKHLAKRTSKPNLFSNLTMTL